ncbi:uncharacterized protein LOC142354764 isoform X2 [Convolutriloba macropyga]|uniref:uncharacterized protein LOC142354764 isoform X2 n=1 Tax=Convolutriloba macropyga TaxID=536237 RepID=UPI003F52257B
MKVKYVAVIVGLVVAVVLLSAVTVVLSLLLLADKQQEQQEQQPLKSVNPAFNSSNNPNDTLSRIHNLPPGIVAPGIDTQDQNEESTRLGSGDPENQTSDPPAPDVSDNQNLEASENMQLVSTTLEAEMLKPTENSADSDDNILEVSVTSEDPDPESIKSPKSWKSNPVISDQPPSSQPPDLSSGPETFKESTPPPPPVVSFQPSIATSAGSADSDVAGPEGAATSEATDVQLTDSVEPTPDTSTLSKDMTAAPDEVTSEPSEQGSEITEVPDADPTTFESSDGVESPENASTGPLEVSSSESPETLEPVAPDGMNDDSSETETMTLCPDGFEKFKTKSSDPEKLRCIAHTRDITIESVQDAARVCQGMNPNATLPLPETAESAFELLDALSDYSPNQKRYILGFERDLSKAGEHVFYAYNDRSNIMNNEMFTGKEPDNVNGVENCVGVHGDQIYDYKCDHYVVTICEIFISNDENTNDGGDT